MRGDGPPGVCWRMMTCGFIEIGVRVNVVEGWPLGGNWRLTYGGLKGVYLCYVLEAEGNPIPV